MSIDRRIAHSSVALPHIQRAQARNSRAFHRALNQLHDLRRNPQSKNNQTDLIPNMDTNGSPQSKNNQSDLVPYSDTANPHERLPSRRQRVLLSPLQAASPPHARIGIWTRSYRCFQILTLLPSQEISGPASWILAAIQYRRVFSTLNPAFRFWFTPNSRLSLRKRTF